MKTFEGRGKLVIGALMIGILALTLTFLQQQFDQGDHRRAIELLLAKPPGMRWSIAQELDARAGNSAPQCEPEIVSSFAGTLDVRCTAAQGSYVFGVDLVRKVVVPKDEAARSLLDAVRQRNLAPAAAADPDAGPGTNDAG